ncbi:MAG: TRAP transporter substrate-binding protein DctP [Burkholderiaceae bacterium]|jgi:TRAP-type C4-dicarboxylate transport system substrate-binding protein|nr:TRAP transporter substrate-binding protein DctP [Burkholderiales bacterium]MCZ8096662.1 TRAP transporter substrate-binding protein DctP [Burkholderiales bacterium]MCZ8341328.1 TRAP transporter substrate-binding protein DctP [Burkholderiaceae bacterium]
MDTIDTFRRSAVRAALAATLAAGLAAPAPALAQEVTLRAVSGFQEGTYFSRNFERFVQRVNAEGKGLVQINYLGGPKAIPTFEQGNALRTGVVDLANTTAAYTASLVPEGLALNYTDKKMAELRKDGTLEYLNTLYLEKGLYYFAKTGEGIQYHIFSNKPIEKADLTGLKIRIAPIFRDFFSKLGASVVQMPPGEVYTALERGVVDGYGWPLLGIFDNGWHERTKYRIDPGFYSLELGIVFSAATWRKLTPAQRAFLEKQGAALEAELNDISAKDAAADTKRQQEAGIQVIRLDPAQSKAYLAAAYGAAWDGLVKTSPTHGAKLRQTMEPR